MNWATNIGGNDNTVATTGAIEHRHKHRWQRQHCDDTRAGYVNCARNVFGDNNVVTIEGGVANWARNAFGDNNNIVLQGGKQTRP